MTRLYAFFIIAMVLGLFVAGCCTKKDCSFSVTPQLVLAYQGFADSELKQKVVLVQNKNTMQIEDSVTGQSYDLLNNYAPNGDIRQYRFLIKFAFDRTDTIASVNYNTYTESVGCNQCFPFGKEKEQVTKYKDLSVLYNGNLSAEDTLVIHR
jgi:hypothetical protein